MVKFIFAAILLTATTVSAQSKSAVHAEPLPLLMHSFYANLFELQPYMRSLEAYSDKKNRSKVLSILKKMQGKADESTTKEIAESTGFNVTYNLLGQHLRDTEYLYEREIYAKSFADLKAIKNFCIGCHDRLPKSVSSKAGPSTFMFKKKGGLDDADMYYIGHQYNNALFLYNNLIRQYKKNQETDELKTALVRKLSFYTRIAQDPKAASESFSDDLKNANLPKDYRDVLKTWISSFDKWSAEAKQSREKSSRETIDEAMEMLGNLTEGHRAELSDPSLISLLRISGRLYELGFDKNLKDDLKADLLFVLARCERDLVPIAGYSLADIYLKECIVSYPKTKTAKRCFADYEVAMKLKFQSGSSEYINSTIETLRKLIEKNN